MVARKAMSVASILLLALILSPSAAAAGRDRTPPTTPRNHRITATSATSVSLKWDPSTDNSGRFSYIVKESSGATLTVDQSRTTFTRPRLWPERTYSYTVYAVDQAGNRSNNSNSVGYTTPPDIRPPTTPTLSATAVGPTRVSLTWTESVDDVSQTFYTLFLNESPIVVDRIGGRSETVSNLTPSTEYEFRVSARDFFGNAVGSNTLSVTTPAVTDTDAPTPPANLHGFDGGSCEGWLTWDQSRTTPIHNRPSCTRCT